MGRVWLQIGDMKLRWLVRAGLARCDSAAKTTTPFVRCKRHAIVTGTISADRPCRMAEPSTATAGSSPTRTATTTTMSGSPTKRAAPAIDVLDDDVLDTCLEFLDSEAELLCGTIRAVSPAWRTIAARCAKRSVGAVSRRLARLPEARREWHARDAAKRLAGLAGLPSTHAALNVAVGL